MNQNSGRPWRRDLPAVAATYLPLEILRQAGRPHGLMAAHFRWTARAVEVLRRHLGWFVAAALRSSSCWPRCPPRKTRLGSMRLEGSLLSFCRLRAPCSWPACCIPREACSPSCSRRTGATGWSACVACGTASRYWGRSVWPVWRWRAICPPPPSSPPRPGDPVAGHATGRRARHGVALGAGQPPHALVPAASRARAGRGGRDAGACAGPADLGQIDAQTRRLIRTLTTVGALGGTWFVWSDMFPALTVLDRVVLCLWARSPARRARSLSSTSV